MIHNYPTQTFNEVLEAEEVSDVEEAQEEDEEGDLEEDFNDDDDGYGEVEEVDEFIEEMSDEGFSFSLLFQLLNVSYQSNSIHISFLSPFSIH